MYFTKMPKKIASQNPQDLLIGALLRVPAQAVHRRIIEGLNSAGFPELRQPHIAVFQYPGPDGANPTTLAKRAGISKQAMNQLLGSLEELRYILRTDSPAEGRSRIVRFTPRGHAAYQKIYDILRQVEKEWTHQLGAADFTQLKFLLSRVWNSTLIQ